ncbi:DUF3570 domain-containing protein [Dyadobacter psychrotolerans]|uniref:DUF3570 domain-containing protein n=1 Tax=Dyadobacter psychrotolerans TaxID=2541721 RepID=A0A4R5DKM7_9BACT|nr:DUF3570 domain-containing protein [Dyadobacter psychrotolerans]TDE12534.1 DUF3570 domain-containing protein [Dyadobacter psychrotolerans]
MNKRYLVVGLLSLMLFKAKAQKEDSLYQKRTVSQTDIELVYSHYIQDGNNSAVTGGRGTEKLTVYSPSARITHTFKDYNTFRFVGGADAVTSASTDKIDAVKSSASRKDLRSYATLGFERKLKRKDLTVGIGSGFSLESDYFSIPVLLSSEYTTPSRQRTFNLGFQAYFDDLRWGRINEDYYRPVKLIYPAELRDTAWFNNYRRTSYNLKLGFTQVINRRLVAGIFPEIAYQKGLLSTPFHRVYFQDVKQRVEKLPEKRYKVPVSLRVNYFAGKRTVLKLNYGHYWDSFGIRANSAELEAAVKTSPQYTFSPFFRIYNQSAARYFLPYKKHISSETFYTSDYDLSAFTSYKGGMNMRFVPHMNRVRKLSFDEINLRYSYFYRSNGLNAHILTLSIRFNYKKV